MFCQFSSTIQIQALLKYLCSLVPALPTRVNSQPTLTQREDSCWAQYTQSDQPIGQQCKGPPDL